ncbi:hypothetical protein Pelo_14002 [Pelomyxa schiedti]|nr:hypothetical protein Pelo_14002 [Pelomyxa schiedti]
MKLIKHDRHKDKDEVSDRDSGEKDDKKSKRKSDSVIGVGSASEFSSCGLSTSASLPALHQHQHHRQTSSSSPSPSSSSSLCPSPLGTPPSSSASASASLQSPVAALPLFEGRKERSTDNLFKTLRKRRASSPSKGSLPTQSGATSPQALAAAFAAAKGNFSCSICYEPYKPTGLKAPRLLSCYHTFSRPENGSVGLPLDTTILEAMESQSTKAKNDLTDSDDSTLTFSEDVIASLPQGVTMSTMCEDKIPLKQIPKSTFICAEHPSYSLELYCRDDETLVCPMCSVMGTHKGHNIATIEEAVSELRNLIERRVTAVQQQLVNLTEKYSVVSDTCASLDIATERSALHIQMVFNELRRVVSEREASLIADLIAKSRIEELRAQCKVLAQVIGRLKNLVSENKVASVCTSDIEVVWEKNAIIQNLNAGKLPVIELPDLRPVIGSLGSLAPRSTKIDTGCGADGHLVVTNHVVLKPGRFYQFKTVQVKPKGVLTAPAWDGCCGGWLKLRVLESLTIEKGGAIDMSGKGYAGGRATRFIGYSGVGFQGDSPIRTGCECREPNGGGGGGGSATCSPTVHCCGGGGGGFGTRGTGSSDLPQGGLMHGNEDLVPPWMGAGGGSGFIFGQDNETVKEVIEAGRGGRGGGVIHICAKSIINHGTIAADGENGSPANTNSASESGGGSGSGGGGGGGGGGGAGGSIVLQAETMLSNTGEVHCLGGNGGACCKHSQPPPVIAARLSESFTILPEAPLPSEAGTKPNSTYTGGIGGYGRIRFDYHEYQGEGLVVPHVGYHLQL